MRKFLSILLLVIFILTFPAALFYFNSERTILSPTYYKNAFEKVDFYNRLMKIDPRTITNYLAQKEGGDQNMDSGPQSDEYIAHVMSMISPEIVKTTVENNINEIFNNVLDKGSKTMTIDLSLIKQAFSIQKLSSQDSEFINQIKEKYVIPVPPELEQAQKIIGKRHVTAPLYLGIVTLLLLLSAAMWPNWKGKLRIPGIALLIFGILTLLASLLLRYIPTPNLGMTEIKEFASLVQDLYNKFRSDFFIFYLAEGGGLFAVGLILIIVSAFLPGQKQQTAPVNIPQSPVQLQPAAPLKKPEIPKAASTKESKGEK
ncbi:MAG: hypothetical protein WC080_01530 [Patescibacteria group bacterium]|jgi:hypothetical protein